MSTPDVDYKLIVEQIHTMLKGGQFADANELVCQALDLPPDHIPTQPIFLRDFDLAFKTACKKQNVPAAYVVFQDLPNERGRLRIVRGGNLKAQRILTAIMDAGLKELAKPAPEVGP